LAKLILDTCVLVAVDRGKFALSTVVDDADNVALPAVVIAEYLTGVDAQSSPGRAASAREFLAALRAVTPVISYDSAIAEHHAELLTFVREQGLPRGPLELIIAATAKATSRTVVTTDKRAQFGELPGVAVRLIDA
jgi:tRNA(fMet)-specific endonuclease VapC